MSDAQPYTKEEVDQLTATSAIKWRTEHIARVRATAAALESARPHDSALRGIWQEQHDRAERIAAELAAESELVAALQAQLAAHAEMHARAVAEAREEQRETMAQMFADPNPCICEMLDTDATCEACIGNSAASAIRCAPLAATPLADRIKELEEEGVEGSERAVELFRERDALKAELAELTHAHSELNDERDALKARVAELDAMLERWRASSWEEDCKTAEARVKELETERNAVFMALPATTNGDIDIPGDVMFLRGRAESAETKLAALQRLCRELGVTVTQTDEGWSGTNERAVKAEAQNTQLLKAREESAGWMAREAQLHVERDAARAERDAARAERDGLRAALLRRCPRHCDSDHESGVCELTRREVAALAVPAPVASPKHPMAGTELTSHDAHEFRPVASDTYGSPCVVCGEQGIHHALVKGAAK